MICPKCGNEFGEGNFCSSCGAPKSNAPANTNNTPVANSNKMKTCKSCGQPIAKSAKKCPNCGAKNSQPVYKKWWFWLIAVIILLIIIGAAGSGDNDSSSNSDTSTTKSAGVIDSTKAKENELGQYSVEILSARLTSTYDNKPAVVVKYKFTNNSNDNPTAFYVAFDDEVYQNGVGLNSAYFLKDGDPYDDDNDTKEIKKDSSIEVEKAYVLNDSNTEIEVEVKELFSFSDKVVSKTFKF